MNFGDLPLYLSYVCDYIGQGTMGLEVLDQVPDLDAIVVPVGGGGLIAGMENPQREYTSRKRPRVL
jgi:threonine dehydratase